MPIYKFHCPKCKKSFELLLVRFDAKAVCPQCGNDKIKRENTTFSAGNSAKSGAADCPHAASCGCSCGCGGGHHHH